MRSSNIIVGLGIFAATALTQGSFDIIIDTTTITVIACGPEISNCPGKSLSPSTVSAAPSSAAASSYTSAPSISTTITASYPTFTTSILPPPNSYPLINASTPISNLSSTTSALSSTTSALSSTSGTIYNSTTTAPSLPASDTRILTASGSPAIVTSLVIVVAPSKSTSPQSIASPSAPTGTSTAGRMVPGITLGLLALTVCLLG